MEQLKEATILESVLLSSIERTNKANNLIIRLESLTRRLGLNTEPYAEDKTAVERTVQPLLTEMQLSFNEELNALEELEDLVTKIEKL